MYNTGEDKSKRHRIERSNETSWSHRKQVAVLQQVQEFEEAAVSQQAYSAWLPVGLLMQAPAALYAGCGVQSTAHEQRTVCKDRA